MFGRGPVLWPRHDADDGGSSARSVYFMVARSCLQTYGRREAGGFKLDVELEIRLPSIAGATDALD